MTKIEDRLTTGSVFKTLISFTLPILISMALQILYGSVDMLIVSNFSSVADVSGVATASQLMALITTICTGLATGATIYIGHQIGKGKTSEIGSTIVSSVTIFMAVSLIIAVTLLVFKSQTIEILNTPEKAISQTSDYLFYATLGIPMIFAYNILSSIFRGMGDSTTPLIAVGIACFINIVLDLLFIAKFNMGAGGAAIATVLAQFGSVVISILIIKHKKIFTHKLPRKINSQHIKNVLKLGLPVALQSTLVSLSFLIITVIINQFDIVYSSAVGISEKITGIIMLVPLSFMQSMSVYVAQNYSAGKIQRTRKALKVALIISVIFGLIMAYVAFFQGSFLARLFGKDPEVIAATTLYLKAYAIDTMLVPIMFCLIGYCNGCGKTLFSMIHCVIGALLVV